MLGIDYCSGVKVRSPVKISEAAASSLVESFWKRGNTSFLLFFFFFLMGLKSSFALQHPLGKADIGKWTETGMVITVATQDCWCLGESKRERAGLLSAILVIPLLLNKVCFSQFWSQLKKLAFIFFFLLRNNFFGGKILLSGKNLE